ncbi:MAG: putative prephenate dehydrogenase [Anaerolineaceae bacterium]|nr:MAG: putative prephenate dehydrogenase [Anaerolineaceae bacterium]
MTVQFTIIGLGQIGASVGLALAEHSDRITRIGHDREPNIAKRAREIGAVDKIFYNLPAAVEKAEIVLLALPANQIRDTLQIIAPCLQENAVVMDTSPVKSAVAEWMKELLPPTCYYVGLTPAINPLYLREAERGIRAAHPDLFTKGVMAISSPQGTVGEAVKLAADLSSLLGAAPYFIDLAEADGMMAALHIMPQLSAAALTNVVMDRAGWKDARRLAGRVYAEATSPVAYGDDEDDALVEAVLQNRENVVRILNEMISNLEELREDISAQERKKLTKWLERAHQGRSKWWQERNAGDWQSTDFEKVKLPKSNLWKRMFGDPGKLFGLPKPNERDEKK